MADINAEWQEILFAKYRYSPNILGLVELLSSPLQDTRDVLDWMLSQTSIDTAEGEILDFMGELIGVSRPPAQENDANILWLCRWEDIADDPGGTRSLAPEDLTTGGYLTKGNGILSKTDPGAYVTDTEYRALIRSKATTFRKKATRSVIYDYLLRFGIRAKIIESARVVELEPNSYDQLNYWFRDYIQAKGFRPSGIQMKIKIQTESDSEV